MKKIVIIGASEFQNPLILKAKSLGYETHVFSHPFGKIGETTADYFYPISIFDKEEILKKCEEIKPDAITTIASDSAVESAVYVATKLGLPSNDYEHILKYTNKYEMRKSFKEAGLEVPNFCIAKSIDDVVDMQFPLIVKPTDRAGSMSIHKVSNIEELKNAIAASSDCSFEKCSIVENVIEGEEYSCETISYKGKHRILAITKKYTTGFPSCIEMGHLEPANISKTALNNLKTIVPKALNALHISNGPSHVEFKIDTLENIRIIEIGGRMGGDCIGSNLVELTTGLDYLKMTIDVALGNEPDFTIKEHNKYGIVKFIFGKQDIDNLERIINKYPNILIEKSEIEPMDHEIIDNSSRYGYYILSFNEEEILNEIKEFI